MYNLYLDDYRIPTDGINWTIVRSYNAFVKIITEKGLPELVSYDHDLSPEHYNIGHVRSFTKEDYDNVKEKTGLHCAEWLIKYCQENKLKIPNWKTHSLNLIGQENINEVLLKAKEAECL